MTDVLSTQMLEIAYETSGPEDGEPVVAVHGWPDDLGTWNGALDGLAAAGCRVYRPYVRGFGPTRYHEDTPRSGQLAALCLDLAELIEGLELERPIVVGHDWGARAGYALAATRPELLSGLVAISVAYASTGPDASVAPDQAHAYWYQWYFSTGLGHRALRDERDEICRYLWRHWSPSWDFGDDEFDRTAAAWRNPDWVETTVHSYSQRWGEAASDPQLTGLESQLGEAPPIQVPAVVLHGEEDGATLVTATADQEAHFAAAYARRVLPGVGHFVPREAPEAVVDAVAALRGEAGE